MARSVPAAPPAEETMTSLEVAAHLGHATIREVRRTMARRLWVDEQGTWRRGIAPVSRDPGRHGQLRWPRRLVLDSQPPPPGRRSDRDDPLVIQPGPLGVDRDGNPIRARRRRAPSGRHR